MRNLLGKPTLFLLLSFLIAAPSWAQKNTTTKNNAAGIYDNLYDMYREINRHRNDSTCISLSEKMRTQAYRQGDKRAVAMSWAYPLSYYMKLDDDKDFFQAADNLMKTSEEAGLWSFYYHAYSQKGIYYLSKKLYAESLELSEQAMKKAYADNNQNGIYTSHLMLARAYSALGLYSRAAHEGLQSIEQEIDLPDTNFGNALNFTAMQYVKENRWQALYDLLNKWEDKVNSPAIKARNVHLKAVACFWLNKMPEYNKYKEEARKQAVQNRFLDSEYSVILLKAVDCFEQGKLDDAEHIAKSLGLPEEFLILAQVYKERGDTKKLLEMQKEKDVYMSDLIEKQFSTELRKYDLQLQNHELSLNNKALQLEKNQLALNNQNLALSNQNLELQQSVLEMEEAKVKSSLEQSELKNKNLQLQKEQAEAEAKLQISEREAEVGFIRTLWGFVVAIVVLVFVVLLLIITRRSNVKLKKSNDALEKASQMKTMFVQNMSHEVRTPLNAICGFSQLLSDPDMAQMLTDEEKLEYGKIIASSTDMLTTLVNDILDLGDIENGTYRINKTKMQVNEICQKAFKTVEHRVNPNVKFTFETDMNDDYTIDSDPSRVQQILVNFLTNAIKHTDKGSIVLKAVPSANGHVTFSVTDTGEGVPLEKSEAIFQRFEKLNTFKQGTGLGLFICRSLAGCLGGTVYLDTTHQGPGARFVFEV